MLVYEKVEDAIRALFGTEENIPAIDDAEIVFKNEDGEAIELTRQSKLFDDGKGGMLVEKDGERKFVAMFIGEAEEAIIPKGWKAPEKPQPEQKEEVKEPVKEEQKEELEEQKEELEEKEETSIEE